MRGLRGPRSGIASPPAGGREAFARVLLPAPRVARVRAAAIVTHERRRALAGPGAGRRERRNGQRPRPRRAFAGDFFAVALAGFWAGSAFVAFAAFVLDVLFGASYAESV